MVLFSDGLRVYHICTLAKNRCFPRILLLAYRLWNSVTNGRFGDLGGLDAIGIDEEVYSPLVFSLIRTVQVFLSSCLSISTCHYSFVALNIFSIATAPKTFKCITFFFSF